MATFKDFANVAKMTTEDKTSRPRLDEILHVLAEYKAWKNMTPDKAVMILEALGPTFVKLGQLMSDRRDVVPAEYCDAFSKLRDDSVAMPFADVRTLLETAYAPTPLDKVFAYIDEKPLGSASIAQVHMGVLTGSADGTQGISKDEHVDAAHVEEEHSVDRLSGKQRENASENGSHAGTKVAIKVRRPKIRETMLQDVQLMKHLLAVARLASPKHAHDIDTLTGFVDEIGKTTEQETDFNHEMENLERFYDEAPAVDGVSSPKGYPELSSEGVLVMEYVEGDELANVHKRGNPKGYDLDDVAQRMAQSYISQFIDYGFFTSDPHMGNVILRKHGGAKMDDDGIGDGDGGARHIPIVGGHIDVGVEVMGHGIDGRVSGGVGNTHGGSSGEENCGKDDIEIIWIDMGMMGTLNAVQRHLVSEVFLAVARDNVYALKNAMLGMTTGGAKDADTGELMQMLSSVLSKYRSANLADIDVGALMTEVLSVLSNQNLVVDSSVTMLIRGLVVIEGVLAEISPSTSIIEIVSKHVMEEQSRPENMATTLRNLVGDVAGSVEAAAKIPTQLSNTLDMLGEGELSMTGKVEVSQKTLSTIYASVSRLCLALLSVGLFMGSSIICTTDMEPKVLGAPLLGVVGFVGAAVLGVYLLVRIMQSRHQMVNGEEIE